MGEVRIVLLVGSYVLELHWFAVLVNWGLLQNFITYNNRLHLSINKRSLPLLDLRKRSYGDNIEVL